MKNWQVIDEKKAREMLQAIYDNLDDDKLINDYSEALEKRCRKPTGTISDFIFIKDLTIDEIMERLKKDDVTYF